MTTGAEVSLLGNLTRDPELRFTTGGRAVATVGIAVNRRFNAPDHEKADDKGWVEVTSFFNVVCWAELGEHVAASLTKGMRVIVSGRLEQRSWVTDDDEKRSTVEVTADAIGPDLRFATVEVEKVERAGGNGRTPDGAYDNDPRAGVPAGAPSQEEPF